MVESPEQRKLLLAIADRELQAALQPLGFTRRNRKSPFAASLGTNSEILVFPQVHSRNTFPRLNSVVAVENHALRKQLGNFFPQTSYPRFVNFYLRVICGQLEDWHFSTESEAKAAARAVSEALRTQALPLIGQWQTESAAKALVTAGLDMRGPPGVIVTPWPGFPAGSTLPAKSEA